MSANRPPRPPLGAEPDMYDDQPYADDYYRGSAQGYQNSRKGNR
jgi:RNA-binding protein 5/10